MAQHIPGRIIGDGAGVMFSSDEAVVPSSTITRETKTQNGHLKNALLASAERSEEGAADTHTQLETHTRVYIEISSIINLSVPIVLTSMLNFMMNIVDLAMVGHLGKEELAAASLGLAYYNTVYFPLSGVCMALDTLFSQAYGARNYSLYALWLLAGTVCVYTCSLAVAAALSVAEAVMLSIQMDPKLSKSAGAFVSYLLPGMFPNIGFLICQKYLQSQHILLPTVGIALIANVFNVFANYLFIHGAGSHMAGRGLLGAPMATSLTRAFQFAAVLVYLKVSTRHAATWPTSATLAAFRTHLLHYLLAFMRLGSTGWLMIALEAWAFDVGQILAAYLDSVSLGAHAAMQTTTGFTYMSFPLALSIAVSIRVGHLLGAGDYTQARVAAGVTVALTAALMLTIAFAFLAARPVLGYLFSSDKEVVAVYAAVLPIAALFQVFDGLQSACAGAFRGMGRNKLVALLNFVGLWLIGQTLGVSLTFYIGSPMLGKEIGMQDENARFRERGIGVCGLWWGLAVGLGCTSITGLWILMRMTRIDWQRMAEDARRVSEACVGASGGHPPVGA